MMKCIQVAKRGRNRDVDILRHTLLQKQSTFCARRLLRDLKEIQDNEIPTVGVSARPLEKDIKTWHANLRGPEGTPYSGGVFHLSMTFPDTYPHVPPQVQMLTPLPEHPNVFDGGTTLCLDMLQNSSGKGLYEGWTSGYSVLSILLQLQSFLFELPHDIHKREGEIRKRVQVANQFVCTHPGCRHKGPIQAWPEFNKKETQLDAFILCKTEAQRLKDETCCFHSRLKLDEAPLGVGVSLSRVPRTGEIRSIETTLDLLSMKAYIKDGVRVSLSKQKFTHWFPVYLGGEFQKEDKILFLAEHSISMLCENSTRKFEPLMILQVLPKLLVTLVVEMMQEATHTSIQALRVFVYFYRLFGLLLERYPEVRGELDKRIADFKADESNRVKDKCSSLGDLLTYALISEKHGLSSILEDYLGESLDRQVMWMLRDVPELGEVEEEGKETFMDEKRDEVAFKTNIVSNRVLLFFFHFSRKIAKGNTDSLFSGLDQHFGQFPDEVEQGLQKYCEKIRDVKNFTHFFIELGLPQLSKQDLTAKLKKSVKNSLQKKYHGDEDAVNALPELNVMMNDFQSRVPSISEFSQDGTFSPADPNHKTYRDVALSYSPWARERVRAGRSLTPSEIARQNDERILRGDSSRSQAQENDALRMLEQAKTQGESYQILSKNKPSEESYEGLTWRSLLTKLELENFLVQLQYNPDFKKLYKLLDLAQGVVESLCLPVIPKSHIKSGHYWMMVLLGKLTSLKHLCLYTPYTTESLGFDGFKYLVKGLNNFNEAGGRLHKLTVVRTELGINSKYEEKFGQALRIIGGDSLRSISLKALHVSKGMATSLAKLLSDNKRIIELDLTNCQLGINEVKEVADGLMRAKQLQRICLANNPQMDYGVNYILYNLAFSPKIAYIDISGISVSQRQVETVEALYKLVKISGSLETLVLNRTNIVPHLSRDFWKAMGENPTLRHLYLDMESGSFSQTAVVGRFVGFNAYKKGSLQILSMRGCFPNYYSLDSFLGAMHLSQRDHQQEYGDPTVANKMSGTQLTTQYRCGLREFYSSRGSLASSFNLQYWLKSLPAYRVKPNLARFLTEGTLECLELSSCYLNKNDADLLGIALADPKCTLKCLSLQQNQLRKEGAKNLAKELALNKSVEALNLNANQIGVSGTKAVAQLLKVNSNLSSLFLYNNNVDVDGARSLKDALAINTSLQILDVGYNRLRKKGLSALAEGLFSNQKSVLRHLALRNNFLSDDTLLEFIKDKKKSKNTSLQQLFVQRNLLSELGISRIEKQLREDPALQEENKEGSGLLVDSLSKVELLQAERLQRTIWVSPLSAGHSAGVVKRFFEQKKCGIVVDVRIKEGPRVPGKPSINRYAFVEFAHATSVLRALRLASKKKSMIDGVRLRIYKAGSRTVTTVKPKNSKNQVAVRQARFGGQTLNMRRGAPSPPMRAPMRGGRGRGMRRGMPSFRGDGRGRGMRRY